MEMLLNHRIIDLRYILIIFSELLEMIWQFLKKLLHKRENIQTIKDLIANKITGDWKFLLFINPPFRYFTTTLQKREVDLKMIILSF